MKNPSPEKQKKLIEKQKKELMRLKKEQGRSPILHSFFFVLVILTVIYAADEIMSNMGVMKTYMIFDLFNIRNADTTAPAYEKAISLMAVAAIPTNILTAVNPLYRSLSDKLGRKLFLVLNILGMALGLFVCAISPNIYVFVIGTCIIGFFSPNDMQVIYLMETAPKEHRAKLCSITKGIGLLSVSLVGVFRSMFYNPEVLSTWRLVYIMPIVIAVAASVAAALLVKESPVFLKKRIGYLEGQLSAEMAGEAVDLAKEETTEKKEKGGLKAALHFLLHDRQVRRIAIVLMVFSVGLGMAGYSQEIMLAPGYMTDDDVNLFYVLEPIFYALFSLGSGFITDKLGRKKGGFIFGLAAIAGQMLFVFGARAGFGPVALSLSLAFMLGGMWSLSDLLFVMLPAESAPTVIRASVMALISYTYVTCILTGIVVGVLYDKIGSANIGVFQMCFFVPIMLFSILFLMFKVRETKNIDMQAIKGEEE